MTYADIIARLEAATGPDRDLDRTIEFVTGGRQIIEAKDYTASIDAALALVERELPGYTVLLAIDECGSAKCSLGIRREVWGATPALAILLALFKAKEASRA